LFIKLPPRHPMFEIFELLIVKIIYVSYMFQWKNFVAGAKNVKGGRVIGGWPTKYKILSHAFLGHASNFFERMFHLSLKFYNHCIILTLILFKNKNSRWLERKSLAMHSFIILIFLTGYHLLLYTHHTTSFYVRLFLPKLVLIKVGFFKRLIIITSNISYIIVKPINSYKY